MLKFAGDFHVKMNTSYFQVYNKYLKSNNARQNLHHTTYQRELSALGLIYILKSHWVQYRFCQSLWSIFLSTIQKIVLLYGIPTLF